MVESMSEEVPTTNVCGRCGHKWVSVKEKPARCPACGTYHWYGESMTNTCAVCGHTWFSRTGKPPLRCPKCKTRSWSSSAAKAKRICTEFVDEDSKKILAMYEEGTGCIRIAMQTGIALSTVIDTIRGSYGDNRSLRM